MQKYFNAILYSICFILFLCVNTNSEEIQARDHELVPRLQGLTVRDYDVKDLDEYTLPVGRLIKGEKGKLLNLEGKITKILYKAPTTKSTFEIYNYYEAKLKESGFKILFNGKGKELGNWADVFYRDIVYLHGKKDNQRFLSAKLSNTGNDIYVAVYVSLGWYSYVMTQVDIIEVTNKNIKTDTPASESQQSKKQVSATKQSLIEKQLKTTGKAIITSIKFGEGSADIRPESDKTLKEIADIIKNNPDIQINILCYTDSIGSPEYCKRLSENRANNVKRSLILTYGADKNRVNSQGMGWVPNTNTQNMPTSEKAYGNRIELVVE